jgi:crossover junction endodeoxyribonuclease RuvC
MRRIVGVDPGLAGGLALVDVDDAGQVARVVLHRTPTTPITRGRRKRREYDVAWMRALLEGACEPTVVPHVALELQGPRPGQGVVSMFRTGLGYGLWLGLVAGAGLPYSIVAPGAWKRHHGLTGLDKSATRYRAQELLPALGAIARCEEGCAEAALLALYVLARGRAPDVLGNRWTPAASVDAGVPSFRLAAPLPAVGGAAGGGGAD